MISVLALKKTTTDCPRDGTHTCVSSAIVAAVESSVAHVLVSFLMRHACCPIAYFVCSIRSCRRRRRPQALWEERIVFLVSRRRTGSQDHCILPRKQASASPPRWTSSRPACLCDLRRQTSLRQQQGNENSTEVAAFGCLLWSALLSARRRQVHSITPKFGIA